MFSITLSRVYRLSADRTMVLLFNHVLTVSVQNYGFIIQSCVNRFIADRTMVLLFNHMLTVSLQIEPWFYYSITC